jgi:hypothetical protein
MPTFHVAALSLNRPSELRSVVHVFGIRNQRTPALDVSVFRLFMSSGPYLVVNNVNEPLSLRVQITVRPNIHVDRY